MSNGLIDGSVYHKISFIGKPKEPLTEADIQQILKWNSINSDSLVFKGEKNGKKLYITKDEKFMVVNDLRSNMYTVLDAKIAMSLIK
jgi:queuine/archaeosine tRNA-ribosyltransferase